jgi:hypothetical protein
MNLPLKSINTKYSEIAAYIIACILLSISIWHFGNNQMGGFDHSALVDTAWRFTSGQKPYKDFYLTTPPAFYLGAWLAFKIWGVKWFSLVLVNIVFSLLTFILQVTILNSFIQQRFSIGISFVCQLLAMVVTSYWWYNSITSITACVFISAVVAIINKPSSRLLNILLSISLFLLLLMKPNTAGLLIIFTLIILSLLQNNRMNIIIDLSICVSLILVMFVILGINPLDVVNSYLEVAKTRGLPSFYYFYSDKPGEEYLTIPLIAICLIPYFGIINIFRRESYKSTQFYAILTVSIAGSGVGIINMLTNSDSNLVTGLPIIFLSSFCLLLWLNNRGLITNQTSKYLTISFMGIVIATLFGATLFFQLSISNIEYMILIISLFILVVGTIFEIRNINTWTSITIMAILLLGVISLYAGQARVRVKYIGPGVFYSAEPGVVIENVPFFEKFKVSPRLKTVVEEIRSVVIEYQSRTQKNKQKIFIGPRLGFAYSAFFIQSPKELPIWFAPGVSYPNKDSQSIINQFINKKFDICIFLKSGENPDFTFIPQDIVSYLNENYRLTKYSNISVYYRQ